MRTAERSKELSTANQNRRRILDSQSAFLQSIQNNEEEYLSKQMYLNDKHSGCFVPLCEKSRTMKMSEILFSEFANSSFCVVFFANSFKDRSSSRLKDGKHKTKEMVEPERNEK